MVLLSSDFFLNKLFQKTNSGTQIQEHYQSVKQLNPDQDRHSVGPDLGRNYLGRLSAGDKSYRLQEKR